MPPSKRWPQKKILGNKIRHLVVKKPFPIEDERKAADRVFAITHKNPRADNMQQPHLDLRSGFAIALRRNMGNTAACDLGCVVLANVSGNTVIRNELFVGATLTAAANSFNSLSKEQLRTPPESTDWNISVCAYRSDATTTMLIFGTKLMSTEVHTLSIPDPEVIDMMTWVHQVQTHRVWCETQRVLDFTAVPRCRELLALH
jgi:hypothetical protein